jgi:hypothetical protein
MIMSKNPHEISGFGETESDQALLSAVKAEEDKPEPIVIDFTFRLPRALLEEIKAMAREESLSANAMIAGLVDIGMRQRGRQAIAGRYPDYVSYLRRDRKK